MSLLWGYTWVHKYEFKPNLDARHTQPLLGGHEEPKMLLELASNPGILLSLWLVR